MNTDPAEERMVQTMQETAAEREFRSKAGFQRIEAMLPSKIGSRLNIPFVGGLSSYLGRRNPLASEAKPPKDSVWLLDNTAYRPVHPYPHAEQPWQAEFVAAYFERDSGKDTSKWIADIADAAGLRDMDFPDGEATIAKRLQPFVNTITPAKYTYVSFPNSNGEKLGPGARNAISSQIKSIPGEYKNGDFIHTDTVHESLTPHGSMLTHFAEPEGWAVISDVDDSIKITMTPSPVGIVKSTFLEDPQPIPGMPELYKTIVQELSPAWFYLSASPYNLYPFLRPFLHQFYPKGTLILRDASWMDLGGFLRSLTQGTEAYKSSRMDKIYSWLPKRKILCVGDSTQSDPEAYGDIYRKHPGWVKAIFIRKVMDVAEMKDTDKNTDERFEKAFKDIPRSVWRTFEEPHELEQAVRALKTI